MNGPKDGTTGATGRSSPSPVVTLCLWAVILVGLAGIGLGLSHAWWAYRQLGQWTPVEAQVIDQQVAESRNSEETVVKRSYRPEIEFALRGGETIRTETLDWRPQPFEPGETLPVRYNPDNPAQVIMASTGQYMAMGLLGAVMGLLFVLVGWVALRKARDRAAARSTP